jgi:hypothetical protein
VAWELFAEILQGGFSVVCPKEYIVLGGITEESVREVSLQLRI